MANQSICRTCGAGYPRGTGAAHRATHDRRRIAELGAWWEVFDRDPSPRAGRPGSLQTPDGTFVLCGPDYSPTVYRFQQARYDTGWIVPFDWPAWAQRGGQRFIRDIGLVARAGPADLARILTTLVRNERFCDGVIADAFESGLIDAVLWRARELGAAATADGGDGKRTPPGITIARRGSRRAIE